MDTNGLHADIHPIPLRFEVDLYNLGSQDRPRLGLELTVEAPEQAMDEVVEEPDSLDVTNYRVDQIMALFPGS